MTPFYADAWLEVYGGDCFSVLQELDAESVHCVVTSPPYWGLRDYGAPGQLGLESTPEEYVHHLVLVFQQVRRVLRNDGTVWLNLGDSYAGSGKGPSNDGSKQRTNVGSLIPGTRNPAQFAGGQAPTEWLPVPKGLKPKDLVGIPWRVAFALQADGWYLRSDIIWSKPNPMPESVTDRPTKSHEYLFLLSKSPRYYFDAAAVAEPAEYSGPNGPQHSPYGQGFTRRSASWAERKAAGATPGSHGVGQLEGSGTQRTVHGEGMTHNLGSGLTRNIRSVWTIATQPYRGAHFAVFPEALPERCILAGCPEGGTVLDPFAGSGTTGKVAQRLGRRAILIDLNPDYLAQAMNRNRDIPLGLGAA